MTNLLTLFLLVTSVAFGQNLNYQPEYNKSFKRSDYKSYVSKDSLSFEVGNQIKIGTPSDMTFKHIYIYQIMGYLPMSVSENHLLDSDCKIVAISVTGNKRKGFTPYIQIRNEDGQFFSVDIEKAIANAEIKSKLSENELLDILKQEKEKLDLGIISTDEFEKRKSKLLKKSN